MALINFPSNPILNQVYKFNDGLASEKAYIFKAGQGGTASDGYWSGFGGGGFGPASAAEINAGVENEKYITPDQLELSKYLSSDGEATTNEIGAGVTNGVVTVDNLESSKYNTLDKTLTVNQTTGSYTTSTSYVNVVGGFTNVTRTRVGSKLKIMISAAVTFGNDDVVTSAYGFMKVNGAYVGFETHMTGYGQTVDHMFMLTAIDTGATENFAISFDGKVSSGNGCTYSNIRIDVVEYM